MDMFREIGRLFCRFRHPVSLPEEIADALGVDLPNRLKTNDLVDKLHCSDCQPKRLRRLMCRCDAESCFSKAVKRERFAHSSLYSFKVGSSWLEFSLHFDDEDRLRRIYVFHEAIPEEAGYELSLAN